MNGKTRISLSVIAKSDNTVHANHVVLLGVLDWAIVTGASHGLEEELTMS